MQNDDPRNIFYNQRQAYEQTSTQTGKTTSGQTSKTTSDETSKTKSTADQTYEQRLAEMKKLASKYEREGEGQLVKDIVNNVLEQKASGNLTNEQLIAFAKRVTPLLNTEQRTRLNSLVEQLLKL